MNLPTGPLNSRYIVQLGDLSRGDIDLVGAKAANLGELVRAGFTVPDGFALTIEAFDHFVRLNSLDSNPSQEDVVLAELPTEIENALCIALLHFDGTPLAVRSSAVAEDSDGASFAGQYETLLGVSGGDALVDAVRRCWASAFHARVSAYKSKKNQMTNGGMGVLVQKLVQADAAGVAFTANPVNGRRNETVVSAVRGLGERLVSGQASPDEWVINGGEASCTNAPENAIDKNQAMAIAKMALQAEAHFGSPQDVEWAIAGGTLYMLQSRPITTLGEAVIEPIPIHIEVPAGYWESDAEHMSKPVSQMARSVLLPSYTNATQKMCSSTGLLLEKLEYRAIGGWMYVRLVPPGGKDTPPLPPGIMKIMLRLIPSMRARIRRATEFVRNKEQDLLVERWYNEWYPEITGKITELREVDLPKLSDDALEEHISSVLALVDRGNEIHFMDGVVNPFVIYDLVTTCQKLLNWDEPHTMELIAGLSTRSTEPARQLAKLAGMARSRPAVRKLIDQPDANTVDRLREVDSAFSKAFDTYLKEYGCRGLAFDLNETTVAESPPMVLQWIRNQIENNYDPDEDVIELKKKRETVQAEARAALANRTPEECDRFEQALARAVRGYPTQEDDVFFTQGVPVALARYALLELGARLVRRKVIEEQEDIFFLEIEEARKAFQQGGDFRALVLRRKGERVWSEQHPGPATYGTQPAQPPLDILPPEPRFLMSVVPWYMERALSTGRGRVQKSGASLTGVAASPGMYRGIVRVIRNEREFHKIQAGDVLVCPATTPAWSVLFSHVGALVTNTGGILSHPAIIAREYCIPAVVATGNATELLKDGQIVIVDGSNGIIEIAAL